IGTQQQADALADIESALGHPVSPNELRDLDHFFNAAKAQYANGNGSWPGGLGGKILAGLAQVGTYGLIDIPVVVGYSWLKCHDQIYGTSLLKAASGGKYDANSPQASPASYREIKAGLQGLAHGQSQAFGTLIR
ncbi:MAG: hypothetical protein ABII00_09135, partial [Elusimicrobiota bacterium]